MSSVRHFVAQSVSEGLMTIYPEDDNRYFNVVRGSSVSRQGIRMNRATVRQLLKLVVERGGRLVSVHNWA
jgi:hypothetical protein